MPGESAVEQAIVNQVAAICYPNGTAAASITGTLINVARGWPTEAAVSAAVQAGSIIIAVHALSGFAKDTTRYTRNDFALFQAAPTLTATLAGNQITFGGTVTAGNTVGVLSQGVAYTYVAAQTDTPSTIASGLASSIPGATASGAVLTLPAGGALPAVVVVNGGTSGVEVGRMQQGFAISAWCPSPALRDTLFAALAPGFLLSYRLTLDDGSVATLMQAPISGPDDVPSRQLMFRRDLRVFYDYPILYTSSAQAAAAILLSNAINSGTPLNTATV